MQKLIISLILFTLITFISCEKGSDSPENIIIPEYDEFMSLINELRAEGCQCGNDIMNPVSPVTWNDTLAVVALKHSNDMVEENFFSHSGSNGSNPGDRIKKQGYNWSTYAENIAWGYVSAHDVFEAWVNSPGHCKNMMNAGVRELGLGRKENYWTLNLATRK